MRWRILPTVFTNKIQRLSTIFILITKRIKVSNKSRHRNNQKKRKQTRRKNVKQKRNLKRSYTKRLLQNQLNNNPLPTRWSNRLKRNRILFDKKSKKPRKSCKKKKLKKHNQNIRKSELVQNEQKRGDAN